MDCHKSLFLTLGLLGSAAAGCQHQVQSVPLPSAQAYNTTPTPPPATVAVTTNVTAKPADLPKRQPRPATCVAFGDFLAREANSAEQSAVQKQQLREQARKAYQQALTLDEKYLPALQELAVLYVAMDDHAHAVGTLQKALQFYPQDAKLWYELGMCHSRQKEWQPALEALGKAVERDPENRQYVNTLGYALARAGRYDESLACFGRVNGEAKAHYNLARMLRHMDQPELTRQHLELALQKDPELADAKSLLGEMNGAAQPVQPAGHVENSSATEEIHPALLETPAASTVEPAPSPPRIVLPPPPVLTIHYTEMPAKNPASTSESEKGPPEKPK
jgi:tetratricopeptide (TPR) repeat protein